jgi:uncharacterized DUF497 family protein
VKFEWDPAKAEENLAKHGISFVEAQSVFRDPLAFTFDDPDHSIGERRFLTVGYSSASRLVVVSHAEYGETIRLISARSATPHERRRHET